jgi:outer membrane protein TolC
MRFAICFILAGFTAAAGMNDGAVQPLTLTECIQLGLKHNYDLRIERLNPEIARYNLSGANGAYEPVFNFQAGEQLLTVPGGVDPKKTGLDSPYEVTTDSVGLGLSGVLPTGLQYGVQATSSRLHELTDFSANPGFILLYPPSGIRNTNQYTSAAAITLQQPLLRNLWIDKYRQTIQIRQKDLKMSELSLRWRVMNLVYNIQQAYYQLIYLKEQVGVEEQALKLVEQLALTTRHQIEIGSTAAVELPQVEAQEESVRTALLASQEQLAKQRNALRNLISADYSGAPDVPIDAAEVSPAVPYSYDRHESWRSALEHRPDLAELRLDLEKQGIQVRYQFNQLFPSLDLVGGYGLQSQENSTEASLADIRDRTKPQYGFGLVLSIPLGGNQAARNSYKAGKAAKEQLALQLKKAQQNILVQVDDSLSQVQSAYRRMESAKKARQYAEISLKGAQQKLADGTSSAFFVLQYQQKLWESRAAEIRAFVDYRLAVAQLELNEGMTLEQNHVNLTIK